MKEAKLLKTISDTEFYSYLVYHQHAAKQNARDVIIHTKIEPMTASKPYDVFLLKAISDYLPLRPTAYSYVDRRCNDKINTYSR
jgi:hypothetical protein